MEAAYKLARAFNAKAVHLLALAELMVFSVPSILAASVHSLMT